MAQATFKISYVVAGDNTFKLTIPQGENDDCDTGFAAPPTGLLVKEDTMIVTVNGSIVPRATSMAGDGWYLHPPVPGAIYNGIQLYDEYRIELVGNHALSGDGNVATLTYDRIDPGVAGALELDLLGGAQASAGQRWELEATTVRSLGLGGLCLMSLEDASQALTICDHALTALTRRLNRTGAYMNRVEHQLGALRIQGLTEGRTQSDLVSADLAAEAITQTRQQILMKSSEAMAGLDLGRLRERAKLLTELA
ncbi:MAG: flagellin [Candidatus Sericytochromatia bacterium]|nr:flagellin [Candidatus Sericytochromatia bacterium]